MGCSRQEPPKPCPTAANPVNPVLGCKILTEAPDLYVDAALPLVLRRTYASDVSYEGLLGQGWSFDFGHRLEVLEEEIHLYDSYGKKDVFPTLEVGESHILPKGRLELSFVAKGHYVYHVGNRYFHFQSSQESKGALRLVSMKDNNDNTIQFFYEGAKNFPAYIALDNHRLFAVQGTAHRMLGVEELVFDKEHLGKNLLKTNTALLLVHFNEEQERLRVGSVETYPLSKEEALIEEYKLYEAQEATLVPMLRYEYSKEDDLVAVYGKEDLLLRTFTYTNHIMTSHGVPEGLESHYTYDVYASEGKVLTNTTNTNESWTFEYEEGRTIVTDALGRESVYEYSPDNYFTSKLNPLHQKTTLRYDNRGQLTEIEDVTGKKTNFDYDDATGVMTSSGLGAQSTHYIYHKKYHKPIIMKSDAGKYVFAYDSRANLIHETLPNKKTIRYERDVQGNPAEIIDALGGVSTFAYNLSGNLTKHTNPRGDVTTLSYDDHENLIKLTNIYGDVTHYSYNTQDKLIGVQHPDGSAESYSYTPQGKLLSHTDSFGATTHYTTDKADKLVAIQNPEGKSTHFTYDVAGNLTVQTNPDGTQTTYSYDALDRVSASKDALGNALRYDYGAGSQLEQLTDPLENVTRYSYSHEGTVSTETSPNEEATQYLYEPQANQVAMVQRADKTHLTYSYTQPNNLLNIVSGSDVTLAFVYDAHQRLHKAESKLYDKPYAVELHYNLLNEIEKESQDGIAIDKEENVKTHSTTLSFLDQHITTKIKTKKRETTLTLSTAAGSVSAPIVLSYDNEAKTQTISYPNGLEEQYMFNETKALTALHTATQIFTYQRDANGRILKLNNTDYSYDAIGRLTAIDDKRFDYDKAGNNLHKQSTYDSKTNQLLEDSSYTYTYDGRGNLKGKLNKHTNTYTYYVFNDLNQLTKVYNVNEKDEVTHYIKYEYDAFNRRVSKEENTVKHYYLYNQHNIIAILDKDKNHLATIVHHPSRTDTPLSITNINGTFYYHRDHQGSIIALSDEEGNIVEEITYDGHYGAITNHKKQEENLTLNPYGYTGRETDKADLYYYRARYYDPHTQRFLSLDPIGFEAGDFNFYRYVGNDPVNYVDPSGTDSCECMIFDATNMTDKQRDKFADAVAEQQKVKPWDVAQNNNKSGIDIEAYNTAQMNLPRAMGGALGTDAEVSRNDAILKTTIATASFGALWAEYGLVKATELVLSGLLNYGQVCDGIDNTDRARSGRGRGAVTKESEDIKKRRTMKIGKIKITW